MPAVAVAAIVSGIVAIAGTAVSAGSAAKSRREQMSLYKGQLLKEDELAAQQKSDIERADYFKDMTMKEQRAENAKMWKWRENDKNYQRGVDFINKMNTHMAQSDQNKANIINLHRSRSANQLPTLGGPRAPSL